MTQSKANLIRTPVSMSEAIFELTGGIQQPGKYTHFHEILYTAADFELDECHVIKNEKIALDRCRVRQNVLLVLMKMLSKT